MKWLFLLCLFPFTSIALEVTGAFTQGGYLLGQTTPGATVVVGEVTVPVTADGRFFAGLSRHQEAEVMVTATLPNGAVATQAVVVSPRTFKVQHITGVPKKTVTPDPAQVSRSRADSAAIKQARGTTSVLPYFHTPFILPAQGPTTGVYGSRRTYEGQERSWHKGHDIAAPAGAPVVAAAAGQVVLARDTFFNGNLIIIDHGQQVFTIYAHLQEMQVELGESVTQGQQIGLVGATGRATGPHLHWGLYWRNMALDPQLIVSAEK